MSTWLEPQGTDITLRIICQPKAKQNEICGLHDGRLKIRITALPIEGKANAALLDYLSTVLKLPKTKILVAKGDTGRLKTLILHAGSACERCVEQLKALSTQGQETNE